MNETLKGWQSFERRNDDAFTGHAADVSAENFLCIQNHFFALFSLNDKSKSDSVNI